MRSSVAAAALAACALAACTGGDAPTPRLLGIQPGAGDPARATPIAIRGEGLPVVAALGADDPARDRLDASYRAWLGAVALDEVRWVDARTLGAAVPPGLADGAHDLVVELPGGARLALPAAFTVARPAALAASLSLPAAIPEGDFTVALHVENVGGTEALAVVPEDPVAAPGHTADVRLAAPAEPPSAAIPPGETATFTWVLRAEAGGAVALQARAGGTDALTGAAVASPLAAAGPVGTTAAEVVTLLEDALADGSPFAQVLAHGDRLLLAPSADGRTAVRHDPTTGTSERLALALPRDADARGSRSANGWPGAPPYPSLGAPGCAPDTDACGPDDEDGRGLWAAGRLAGEDWLLASAARRSGGLAHVYLAPGGPSPLGFRYVDLFGPLAASAGALGAALFAPDGLYLAVTARHPALLALRAVPPAPGLDPGPGELVDLELDAMPGVGTAGEGRSAPVAVDALALHAGLLHVATAVGIVRATVPVPGPWSVSPGDWLDVTPAAPAWSAHASVAPGPASELTPASRAVPALVAAEGALLAARNTVAGPQLWRCDPARTPPAETCEAEDWELVARDPEGALSRLGRPDLGPVTLLAAGAGAVVVGYDSARGVQLFRAAAASPLGASDFAGLAGCSAAVAGCEGLSGPGLGRGARLPHVLDGGALSPSGPPSLYLVAGDGAAPARVYRVPLEGT